jgi:peroxiredoxin
MSLKGPGKRGIMVLVLAAAMLAAAGSGWAAGKAPDFTLQDTTGKDFSLSQFRGKVVVLNFFTINCQPCRAEMPDLNKIYQEKRGQGLQILGICIGTDPMRLRFLAKQMNLDYPFLVGTDEVDRAYGSIVVVPTTFIIDGQGNLVEKIEHARKKEYFDGVIRKYLP